METKSILKSNQYRNHADHWNQINTECRQNGDHLAIEVLTTETFSARSIGIIELPSRKELWAAILASSMFYDPVTDATWPSWDHQRSHQRACPSTEQTSVRLTHVISLHGQHNTGETRPGQITSIHNVTIDVQSSFGQADLGAEVNSWESRFRRSDILICLCRWFWLFHETYDHSMSSIIVHATYLSTGMERRRFESCWRQIELTPNEINSHCSIPFCSIPILFDFGFVRF